ncbi:hypothetical protein QR680_001817 [Steinernema hermaphroditum]|uniref:G-protein coupled receptors family 1 profile domain-containing protein n=1 Tax=Steinernema hermaphroditum TaxID=289476 RepID=A0AA39LGY6_9BILA|nr:hypothetical protein QR680_001817 [Steinernema hermaphroditum]
MNNSNDCNVYYLMFPDPATSTYVYIPFAFIYVAMFIMGILGNVSIIHVTLQHRTLQTVQNMFILNLAASDIIVCLLSLPITPVTNIFKNWYFGSVLCRLIPWVQGVSVFICTFSLGAIALDRYILVVHPHARPLTKRGALIVTAFLWTLSVIVTLPYAIFMYVESYKGICGVFCTERWPNAPSRRAYTMVVLVSQFVLPFTLMAFCYAAIFARLKRRAKARLRRIDERSSALEHSNVNFELPRDSLPTSSSQEESNERHISTLMEHHEKERQRLLNQTRRTTTILVSMVVIFGLTWLPHNVVSLIIEYDEKQNFFQIFDMDFSYLINLFTHSIAMTNIVSNPVLYAWLNPTFRELVIQTCFKDKKGEKNQRNPNNKHKAPISNVPVPNSDISYSDHSPFQRGCHNNIDRRSQEKAHVEPCILREVRNSDSHPGPNSSPKQDSMTHSGNDNKSGLGEDDTNFCEGDTFV